MVKILYLFIKKSRDFQGNLKGGVVDTLWKTTLDLQGEAQRIAPVDKGDLRGSGYSTVEEEENEIIGEVGFTEPYALEQHENLYFTHPKGGQAKYLEGPFNEKKKKYEASIMKAVERGIK
jgi:hypothetical protein